MSFSFSSISHQLLQPTSFFGIKLWITIAIWVGVVFLLAFSIILCFFFRRRTKSIKSKSTSSMDKRLLSRNGWDLEMSTVTPEKQVMYSDHRNSNAAKKASGRRSTDAGNGESATNYLQKADNSDTRTCNQYTLKEIEGATNGFAGQNIIGSGDYGIVYHGILLDNTQVAVKKLIVNSGRFRDFAKEVETMWCVRHKNLVKLLGFCTEGTYRMLIYEFVDNGNLKQWLHQSICKLSPLAWNIRMHIIAGIAKGLAYLHEDSEPAIFHQHLKSSNILLDKQWNPKISDLGISNFLGPEWSHAIARPMGMSGYLAPESSNTGILDVKGDVYSFGILVMEIISGKTSVQHTVTEIEEFLIDWIKLMVSTQRFDEIVDPKLPEMPPLKELKRILLIALRCVDPDADNRPRMGDVIHMLEPRDLLLRDEHEMNMVTSRRSSFQEEDDEKIYA